MLQSNSNESRTLELLKVKSVLSGLLSEVVETIDDREEKQLLEKITYINDQLQLAISRYA